MSFDPIIDKMNKLLMSQNALVSSLFIATVSLQGTANEITVYGDSPVVHQATRVQPNEASASYDGRYELYEYPMSSASQIKVYSKMPYHGLVSEKGDEALVRKGTFRENLLNIAAQFNYGPVIWDAAADNCVWRQVTEYRLSGKEPRELLAYYAATQDFSLKFSTVDEHIEAVYNGPLDRLAPCKEGLISAQDAPIAPTVLDASYSPIGPATDIDVF